MSSQKSTSKITVPQLTKMHQVGEKVCMVTAYDFTMSKILDQAGVDILLVGDSLGMVIQGHDTTLPVSIDDMIYHTRCVARGAKRAHVMADMPFMSYQSSHEEAVKNAGNLIKAGAESVKIEGGEEMADLIWYLNKVGVPVMGHIGLKPQSVHTMGGYKVQGKNPKDADAIVTDAQVLEEAGAFSILIEGVPAEVAEKVQKAIQIPLIGIGSGPSCAGQVLVCYDLLGFDLEFKPAFVKKYMDFYSQSQAAIQSYVSDVKKGQFPSEEHTYRRNLSILPGGESPQARKARPISKKIDQKKSKKKKTD